MADKHIIVIGAGISGLAAAYELQKAGHDVQVLEARDYAGGRMHTVDFEGFRVELGALFFTSTDEYLLNTARELGLADEIQLMYQEGLYFATYRDGAIYPVNFLSVGSYLGWKGVSLGARLAMIKLLPHLLRYRGVPVYHLEQGPGPDEESFEEFFYRRINREMYDYWAYPTFQTNCTYDGGDLSAKAFLTLLMGYLNAKTYQFKRGMSSLPEAIARRVNVHLNSPVESIEPRGASVRVTYTQDGTRKTLDADRCVIAVPGVRVPALFEDPRPAWRAFFSQVRYIPNIGQFFIMEYPDFDPGCAPSDGAMLTRPDRDHYSIAAILFLRGEGGRWLVGSEPAVGHYNPDEPTPAILERTWADIERLHPGVKGRRRAALAHRWPEKVPTFHPGYLSALKTFWADPQENPVYFCGDYLAGPGTGAALFTGREAAARVLRGLG